MDNEAQDTNSDLITIRQFGDISEALMAEGCLQANGIECFLADLNIARVDWPLSRGIRLQVSPVDAAEATALLDQPPLDEVPPDDPEE